MLAIGDRQEHHQLPKLWKPPAVGSPLPPLESSPAVVTGSLEPIQQLRRVTNGPNYQRMSRVKLRAMKLHSL
eukprot:1250474-Pyramimonas_sp.AAC.1